MIETVGEKIWGGGLPVVSAGNKKKPTPVNLKGDVRWEGNGGCWLRRIKL